MRSETCTQPYFVVLTSKLIFERLLLKENITEYENHIRFSNASAVWCREQLNGDVSKMRSLSDQYSNRENSSHASTFHLIAQVCRRKSDTDPTKQRSRGQSWLC